MNTLLKPLPEDSRDFSASKLLGVSALSDLPPVFVVASPLAIKDQFDRVRGRDSNGCTACATSDLDDIATTNNLDVYGSTILVGVGGTANTCVSAGGGTPGIPRITIKGLINIKGVINIK